MDTTIKNASYESIPMQPLNEDQKASSENSVGSRSTSNGRTCVIVLGVAVIGSLALGLGFLLTGGKRLSAIMPLSGSNNTQGSGAPSSNWNNSCTRFIDTISTSTQQLINSSISTPNIKILDQGTPDWLNRTSSQESSPPTTTRNTTRQYFADTTNTSTTGGSTSHLSSLTLSSRVQTSTPFQGTSPSTPSSSTPQLDSNTTSSSKSEVFKNSSSPSSPTSVQATTASIPYNGTR
ncbi:hypothetical protein [Endozoicomonas sp. YOMI1]|uniref:hypothetical protein n=1 Tax=Endozoicomonas sp. YOMI1 TaxID=2828739 RepID=UPI0021479D52|nr:hypothetical protein [Endozoicomonas sp. YOMI1]